MPPTARTRSDNRGSANQRRSEQRLTAFIAHAFSQPVRVIDKGEGSLSCYSVFWSIAAHEGRTQVEISELTGLSSKTVSRVVAHLGTTRGGLGWVKQVFDEDDRRLRRLFLSHRGKSLLTRLLRDFSSVDHS